MSRTDKDTPWWVFTKEWEEDHCHSYWEKVPLEKWEAYWRHEWRPLKVVRECDLPLEPRPQDYCGRGKHQCQWVPVRPFGGNRGYNAPRWAIEHIDISPTRVKVRDDCILARKQYQATGDVDVIPPINQHRHCAAWLYG